MRTVPCFKAHKRNCSSLPESSRESTFQAMSSIRKMDSLFVLPSGPCTGHRASNARWIRQNSLPELTLPGPLFIAFQSSTRWMSSLLQMQLQPQGSCSGTLKAVTIFTNTVTMVTRTVPDERKESMIILFVGKFI